MQTSNSGTRIMNQVFSKRDLYEKTSMNKRRTRAIRTKVLVTGQATEGWGLLVLLTVPTRMKFVSRLLLEKDITMLGTVQSGFCCFGREHAMSLISGRL